MTIPCPRCGARYDDARQPSECPHADPWAERRAAGLALCGGKRVRFRGQHGGKRWLVVSCGATGLLTLAGIDGEFEPGIFEVSSDGR